MTSKVVKDLQQLHFRDRSVGLEDVGQLQLDPAALLGLGPSKLNSAPVTPRHLPPLRSDLTEPQSPKKEKLKIHPNDNYYYKSPCPEKREIQNSPAKRPKSPALGLTEKAAQFCKENLIDGFNCKVFVGNISYRVKDAELRDFFNLFGKVIRANVCRDKKTKRSRGFGFIIFSNREEAEQAIHAKDFQLTIDRRLMTVSWAERRRKDKAKESSGLPDGQCLQDLAISFLESEKQRKCEQLKDEETEKFEESLVTKLNDDILLQIFTSLSLRERINMERVCRRWQSLSRQTWKTLTSLDFKGMFRNFQGAGGLTDRIFRSVLKRGCYNLQSLDLASSPYLLSSHGLFEIGSICTELRFLNLSGVAVTNDNLKDIGKRCQHLESLILGRCLDFGEKGLWWFLKEAQKVKHLEVTDNVRVNGKCFWMLQEFCNELVLTDCVKVSDNGLENVSNKAPNLEILDITNCLLVSDAGLAHVCGGCKNLRKLTISGTGPGVTQHGMLSISALENLEYLNISQNKAVTDDVLKSISRNCKQLQYLNIEACQNRITNDGVVFLSGLRYLKNLNISYLAEITDSSIQHLAANTNLRSLVCRACSKLTNEALVSVLLFSAESLCEVDFSGCFLIDNDLLDNSQLTRRDEALTELKINIGGTSVTAECVASLRNRIGNCQILLQKTYNSRLRSDYDETAFAPFYSSDEDDDDFEETGSFHAFSARGYTVRSSDLQDQTLRHNIISDDQLEDFFEADDPALLDELEDQLMFN